MKIDANELKELYMYAQQLIAVDERFYAVPGTNDEYALSSYGRLYRLGKNGLYNVQTLGYKNRKEGYFVQYPGQEEKFISIQTLIKRVFYPHNTNCYLWNPHINSYSNKRWKVDELEILEDKKQILEVYIAKINGEQPDFADYENSHGFVYRQEFEKTINEIVYSRYKNVKQRTTSPTYKEFHPKYADAIICEEWKANGKLFGQWMIDNIYYYPGELCIDKDILNYGEQKYYSPDTCCMIPYHINNIFNQSTSELGYLIQELTDDKGNKRYRLPYDAYATNKSSKKSFYSDSYKECLNAGRKKKAEYIRQIVADERKDGYIPEKILAAMEEWANRCEKGLIKIWEPDAEKLKERGLI